MVSKLTLKHNCLFKKELDFLKAQRKPDSPMQHLPKGLRHGSIVEG